MPALSGSPRADDDRDARPRAPAIRRTSSCRRRDLPTPGGAVTSTARALVLLDARREQRLQHAELGLAAHAGRGLAEQRARRVERELARR